MPNLVEALQPRVERIARSVSRAMKQGRAYSGGASWQDYDKYPNRIKGTLIREDAIEWRLASGFAGYEKAVLYTENIRPLALAHQEFGDTTAIGAGNLESHQAGTITVPEGATYDDTLSFTWSQLTTREDAYSQGLKAAISEWVKGETGGLGAGVNTSQEFTAEFNQKYGSQQSESTTFSRHVILTKPGTYSITYTRKSGDAQQRVTAKGDYEHSIRFVDEHTVISYNNDFDRAFGINPIHNVLYSFGWASMAELLAVMRREAPSNYALYQPYMDHPEDAGNIGAIAAPPGDASFVLNFKDNVSYDVDIRRVGE